MWDGKCSVVVGLYGNQAFTAEAAHRVQWCALFLGFGIFLFSLPSIIDENQVLFKDDRATSEVHYGIPKVVILGFCVYREDGEDKLEFVRKGVSW